MTYLKVAKTEIILGPQKYNWFDVLQSWIGFMEVVESSGVKGFLQQVHKQCCSHPVRSHQQGHCSMRCSYSWQARWQPFSSSSCLRSTTKFEFKVSLAKQSILILKQLTWVVFWGVLPKIDIVYVWFICITCNMQYSDVPISVSTKKILT